MLKRMKTAALALALSLGSGACSDFLTGPKLADNPNRPTTASNANLLVSAMTNLNAQQESHLVRTVCIWMQHCGGTQLQYNNISLYIVGDDEFYYEWAGTYTSGGLLDLRRIYSTSIANADSGYAVFAALLDSFIIVMAPPAWADVPYSQA